MNEKDVKQKMETIYFPEYRIYKPNKSGSGAASRLQIKIADKQGRHHVYLFLESAQQTGLDSEGNASFAWTDKNKKVTFKMEALDVGELLCVLDGTKEFAGMPAKDGKGGSVFHQTPLGNTILKFQKAGDVYWLGLSSKKKDGTLVNVKHVISMGEGKIIKILLEEAVKLMFGWR